MTNSQESVTLTVESDAFGNIQSKTGTGSTNYHLTTKELDPDTELYYFVARWYDPVEGRFISQDPKPEVNLYRYVRNNPMNWVDPIGLHTVAECKQGCSNDLTACMVLATIGYTACMVGCFAAITPIGAIICHGICHVLLAAGIAACNSSYNNCINNCQPHCHPHGTPCPECS